MRQGRAYALMLVVGLVTGYVGITAPSTGAKVLGPNGEIAFTRDEQTFVANPDGSHERLLVADGAERPVWSPDGSRLAMTTSAPDGRATTALVNADGSGYTVEPLPGSTLNLACGPWSPDGTRLACLAFDHVTPDQHEGVFTVRASDWGDLRRVTSNPCVGEGCEDNPGDFSPDGTRIVFIREDPNRPGGNQALFVVNTDGTGLRQISPWGLSPISAASWSPDGRWILFDAKGHIDVVHPNGSGLTQIHVDVNGWYFAQEPVWSPNGKRIALTLFLPQNGVLELYTMRANGTGLVQVTHSVSGSDSHSPDWGPHPLAT